MWKNSLSNSQKLPETRPQAIRPELAMMPASSVRDLKWLAGPLRGQKGQKADEWGRKVLRGLKGLRREPLGLRLRLSDSAVLKWTSGDPAGSGSLGCSMLPLWSQLFIRGVQRT